MKSSAYHFSWLLRSLIDAVKCQTLAISIYNVGNHYHKTCITMTDPVCSDRFIMDLRLVEYFTGFIKERAIVYVFLMNENFFCFCLDGQLRAEHVRGGAELNGSAPCLQRHPARRTGRRDEPDRPERHRVQSPSPPEETTGKTINTECSHWVHPRKLQVKPSTQVQPLSPPKETTGKTINTEYSHQVHPRKLQVKP